MAPTDRTSTWHPGADERVARSVAQLDRWSERLQRWFAPLRERRPSGVDVVWAMAIGVVQIVGTRLYSVDEPSPWALDAFAYALLAVGPVALLYRRRWPGPTLLVACGAAAVYAATGYPRGPAGLPAFLLAVVNAVMMDRRAFAWGVILVTYPVFVWAPSVVPDEEQALWTVAAAMSDHVWVPLVGAVAELVHIRVERRVERAQAQREAARRRASEERLRIARELHDVLAHTISLVNVQAGVALHLLHDLRSRPAPRWRRLRRRAARRWGSCARYWRCSAAAWPTMTRGGGRPALRPPGCGTSRTSCDGPARPVSTWSSSSRVTRTRYRPVSTSRRSGSFRRR